MAEATIANRPPGAELTAAGQRQPVAPFSTGASFGARASCLAAIAQHFRTPRARKLNDRPAADVPSSTRRAARPARSHRSSGARVPGGGADDHAPLCSQRATSGVFRGQSDQPGGADAGETSARAIAPPRGAGAVVSPGRRRPCSRHDRIDETEHAVDAASAQTRGELRSIREHHAARYGRGPLLLTRTIHERARFSCRSSRRRRRRRLQSRWPGAPRCPASDHGSRVSRPAGRPIPDPSGRPPQPRSSHERRPRSRPPSGRSSSVSISPARRHPAGTGRTPSPRRRVGVLEAGSRWSGEANRIRAVDDLRAHRLSGTRARRRSPLVPATAANVVAERRRSATRV